MVKIATGKRPSGLAAQTALLFEGGRNSNEMISEIPRKSVREIQTFEKSNKTAFLV
jgi:hypothetical protein